MLSFLWGEMEERDACGKVIVIALLGMGWTCVEVLVNYQLAEDFSLLQSTWIRWSALGLTQPPIQWGTGATWPRDKVVIAWSWPLTSTSAEVKNEGNSTPPYTFLPCTGTTLPFYFMWQRCELKCTHKNNFAILLVHVIRAAWASILLKIKTFRDLTPSWLVISYELTLNHFPEDFHLHQQCCENLKLHSSLFLLDVKITR